MSKTDRFDDLVQVTVELLFVCMRDSTNLVVVPATQNMANKKLICTHLALGGLVNLHDIIIDLLGNDGGSVLGSVCSKYHEEVSFGFHAQIALDGLFQTLVECLVVGAFDCPDVGVRSAEQDVVQNNFLGSRA